MIYDALLEQLGQYVTLVSTAVFATIVVCILFDGLHGVMERVRRAPERRKQREIEFMRQLIRDIGNDPLKCQHGR